MIFIDQGEEGGWQDFFIGGDFLSEGSFGQRGIFAGGEFWPEGGGGLLEGGFGRRGVLPGGWFCPVPIVNNGGYTKY